MEEIRIALVACVLAAAMPAFSQEAEPKKAAEAPKSKAESLYRDGVAAYEAGDFAGALAAFTASYNLSGESGLLFNLGVCAEKTGDDEKAAAYFALYLEEHPDAKDRGFVNAHLEAIRKRAREKEAAATVPASEQQPAPKAEATKAPEPTTPAGPPDDDLSEEDERLAAQRRKAYAAPALLTGLGGLVVATGALTAIMAHKKYDDLDASCAPDCSDDAVSKARATAIAADVQFGVGGAAAVAGIVWLLVARKKLGAEKSGEVAVNPVFAAWSQGGVVAVQGRF